MKNMCMATLNAGVGMSTELSPDAVRRRRAEEDAQEDFDDWWRQRLASGGLIGTTRETEQPTLDPAVASYSFSEPAMPEGTAL